MWSDRQRSASPATGAAAVPPVGEPPAALERLLTVVLVTSPVLSNPSTEMLEWTLGSYVGGGGLELCPKIIVSDGFVAAAGGQQARPKHGRVPEGWVAPYAEFRARLDSLVAAAAQFEHSGDGGGSSPPVAAATARQPPGSPPVAAAQFEHQAAAAAQPGGGSDSETATRPPRGSSRSSSSSSSSGGRGRGGGGSGGMFLNCTHVRMPEHKGFGGCLYSALRRVATPYVLVLQHDRPCLRRFHASRVVAAMEASRGLVKYVGLPTKSSLARMLPANMVSRWHIRLGSGDLDPRVAEAAASAGVQLQVLLFWYDSTHICEAAHYRDFVFSKGHVPGGGFPEDSFGQAMHADICAAARAGDWRGAHAAYATFLLRDEHGGPMVGHLRGRRYVDQLEAQRRNWGGHKEGPKFLAPLGAQALGGAD